MPQARRPAQRRPPRQQRPASREPRAPRQRSDLLSRILVAIPAAVVAIAFIDVGGVAFALFMIGVGCVCLSELYALLNRWKPVPVIGFAALAAMVLGARFGTLRDVIEVAMVAVPLLFLAVLARGNAGGATVAIAGTLLGIYWVGFAFAHAELLRQLPHGKSFVLDVAIGTFLGDTGAYLGGRLFGRMPLAPSISPSKTVEGLVCGGLTAIVSVYLAAENSPWLTHGDALLLGIAIAILGPIGDLFESLVKRDAGAKDAGTLFGAHGGALDRLDGVMFTIVAAYYIYLALGVH
jgi:phosphatidate cytidylyltransferase